MQVRAKLLAELADGALIVDYTDALGRADLRECRGDDRESSGGGEPGEGASSSAQQAADAAADAEGPFLAVQRSPQLGEWSSSRHSVLGDEVDEARLALAFTLSAPVSWDGAHQFYVWRVDRRLVAVG